ncbi:ABC transporter substrate-binding protein [Micromonospora andamanensis]|uniref:ABC transporter substrate-binding protein n=1 Tax=Micromonospora andamanensis TaxID=1287068 RepID=UPI0019522AF7|nr:extracellular solute-binding protein [Micromonospora andamanensis]
MKQRALWSAVLVVGLATAGCGSASDTGSSSSGGSTDKLVVWDWKSGEPSAGPYIEKAKADFAKKHPDVTLEFVAQPFDQYYTLLGAAIQSGKGPDVMLFNGGGQIRDRVDALVPLDEYVAEDKQRLAGWDAFAKDGKTYAGPVTLQGHPIYYNKALYEKAGLDPASPATTWDKFLADCAAIAKAGAKCFALGNKEGAGIQFWMSALGSAILTAQEYDDWIAGKRDWNSPNVKRIFQLWKEAGDAGLNNEGANSTAMFNDAFALFQSAKAAHVIGLMSDVGHWKDFNEFLTPDKLGVMSAPVVTAGTTPSLAYDGGIGYAVAKWTKDPKVAADLVRSLTSTDALNAFYADAGAIASDTTIDVSQAGPAAATIVSQLKNGKPALHVALSSKTLDLMGRIAQQLLSGSISVDEAVKQLGASDQAG